MPFYTTLAKYYSAIFPVTQAHEATFKHLIHDTMTCGLDVGCATGQHTRALMHLGLSMTGIDISEVMIAQAQQFSSKNLIFKVLDMTQLHQAFPPQSFDVITCLGNTLVHIPQAQVEQVIDDFYTLLKPHGLLVLQIVNYDMIFNHHQQKLPCIETEDFIFNREYVFTQDACTLKFQATLIDKHTDEHFSEETVLYPLFIEQLTSMLQASFHIRQLFGSWQMSPYNQYHSPSLIIAAVKK